MTSPSHSFIFTRSNTRVCREPQLVFHGPVWAMRPTAAQKDKENVEGEADGDAPRAPPAARRAGGRQAGDGILRQSRRVGSRRRNERRAVTSLQDNNAYV